MDTASIEVVVVAHGLLVGIGLVIFVVAVALLLLLSMLLLLLSLYSSASLLLLLLLLFLFLFLFFAVVVSSPRPMRALVWLNPARFLLDQNSFCTHRPHSLRARAADERATGRGHEKGASSPREERSVRGVRGGISRGPRVRVGCRVGGGERLQLKGVFVRCCSKRTVVRKKRGRATVQKLPGSEMRMPVLVYPGGDETVVGCAWKTS